MNFDEYQKEARKTAFYPGINEGNLTYVTLGLTGEAGEVAEKVKKILRDQKGFVNETNQKEIKKELGDVLWYISNICNELKIELNDVALTNIDKLNSRLKRNKLTGSGDNR